VRDRFDSLGDILPVAVNLAMELEWERHPRAAVMREVSMASSQFINCDRDETFFKIRPYKDNASHTS
jgi:hypothetical protein